MNRVARTLEQDTAARFAFYADDVVIWTEASDFPSKEPMQSELQAAIFSLENSLSRFQLQLSTAKTQLLSVDGKRATNKDQTISLQGPSESHVPPSAPTMQVQDVKHRIDLYSPYSMAKPSNEVEAMLATRAVPKEGAKPGEYFPSTSSSSTLPSSTAPTLVLPVAAVEIAAEKPIKDTCMTKTIQRRASTHKSSEAVLLASRASMLRSKSLKETPIDCESLGMLLTTRPTQLRSESMTVRIADVPKRVLTLAGIGCASLILLVAVLVFVVVSGPGYLVCVTAACKLYSSLLAKALAPSGNPCNDFHHYVCATWEANNKMSLHKYVLSGPGVLEAKPAVLFGVTMKKTEAMLQEASENKTYYQRFFEKLAEDFSRPGAKVGNCKFW
ncbi:uncharacterized protein LOC144146350 [Haemaphysalis longicornis]